MNAGYIIMCCACIIATLRRRLQATRGACNVITVNLHTLSPLPPQKGLETRGGGGKNYCNFQRGAGLGWYGCFLELHITIHVFSSSLWYVIVEV